MEENPGSLAGMEISMVGAQTLEPALPSDPAAPQVAMYPKGSRSHTGKTCAHPYLLHQLTTVKLWKHLKCLLANKEGEKMFSVHATEFHSATESKVMWFARKRVHWETAMLNEASQMQTNCMCSLVCGVQVVYRHMNPLNPYEMKAEGKESRGGY